MNEQEKKWEKEFEEDWIKTIVVAKRRGAKIENFSNEEWEDIKNLCKSYYLQGCKVRDEEYKEEIERLKKKIKKLNDRVNL